MRKAVFILFIFSALTGFSQETIKCFSTEVEHQLQEQFPERLSDSAFEEWIQEKISTADAKTYRGVVTLPIVFHVLHAGEPVGTGNNVATALINAQLEQLNDDFRRKPGTAGFNTNPVGADLEIEFCMAVVDPDGNVMEVPGINRINTPSIGLNSPGFSINYLDNMVKPNTIWNPGEYINVWVTPINLFIFTVLGYAQFPSASGLAGLETGTGGALTDGVVIAPRTVGGVSLPNPLEGVTGRGRTLTHELGHFFGLRHIWGDGGCNADDYCDDTPISNGSSSGCQIGKITCNSVDMVENYMDYSDDLCMNVFTQDQKTRVDAVLLNSPRRSELLNSTVCSPDITPCPNPFPQVTDMESNVTENGVFLSWEPISGSLGCQVRGGTLQTGFVQTFNIFQAEAFEFFVPASALNSGTTYQWQVRCGCSLNPPIGGPWSATSFFSFGEAKSGGMQNSDIPALATIFPNPADQFVYVTTTIHVPLIEIFDATGRQMEIRKINEGEGLLVRFETKNWPAGIYFVKTHFREGPVTTKLILE